MAVRKEAAKKTPWAKSSEDLVRRFNDALPKHAAAEPRKMFGYAACFVNGNFFVGLHEQNVAIRLPGGSKEKFAELAKAKAFDPMRTGKGMKDWWLVPSAVHEDPKRLASFLRAAFEVVRTLPAKAPKKKAAPKAAPARAKKTPAKAR